MRSLIEYRKVLDCRNAVAKLAASGPLICPKASQTAANRESTPAARRRIFLPSTGGELFLAVPTNLAPDGNHD